LIEVKEPLPQENVVEVELKFESFEEPKEKETVTEDDKDDN